MPIPWLRNKIVIVLKDVLETLGQDDSKDEAFLIFCCRIWPPWFRQDGRLFNFLPICFCLCHFFLCRFRLFFRFWLYSGCRIAKDKRAEYKA